VNGLSNEDVLNMINDAIDRYNNLVISPLHDGLESLRSSSMTAGQDLSFLKAQMQSMYGNGSGRIGAIERLDKKLDNISIQVIESKGKETGIEKTRQKYHEFLYWLGGGAAVAGFTMLLRYLDHVK
jgi:hypothetical protein